MTQVHDGDLVIHKPADPTEKGSGPFYVDCAESYGGNTTRIAVAMVSSDLGWGFDLPRDEVEVIGHHEVPDTERLGYTFSLQAIEAMRPIIDQATERLFVLYPELRARFEAEEVERAADEAATADQLTVGCTSAGFDAYAHCLRRGKRIVWTCRGHSTDPGYSREPRDCAEVELNRRREQETADASMADHTTIAR